MTRCLGRKAVKTDSRTLRLACYITPALPPPPAQVDWSPAVTGWGVLLNDQLGDCTIAGVGHAVQTLTANVSGQAVVTDDDVLSYYKLWDGYDGTPATDNGGIELDVLNNWQKNGFAGHALLAFAQANPANTTEVKQAINLFGGLYIGMQVPNFIMAGPAPGVWDVTPNDGGIDGGHCVWVVGYNDDLVKFVSWGTLYEMKWAFWARYVDEAHALLSNDFIKANGLDPAGFDLSALQADLAAIV